MRGLRCGESVLVIHKTSVCGREGITQTPLPPSHPLPAHRGFLPYCPSWKPGKSASQAKQGVDTGRNWEGCEGAPAALLQSLASSVISSSPA